MRNRTHLDWNNEIRSIMGLDPLERPGPEARSKAALEKKLRKERSKNQRLELEQRRAQKALKHSDKQKTDYQSEQ